MEAKRVRMKILVLGGDGYLGWPTALHLSARGHDVTVVDNLVRREYDREMGVDSLVPIAPLEDRVSRWKKVSGHSVDVRIGNLTDAAFTYGVVAEAKPDAIVHFGEQRSAPVLHDRPRARRLHTSEQRRGQPQRDVRDPGDRPRHPSREARDDGRVRLPQHRHRRGLHRDHPQGPHRRAALPEAAGLVLPPVQGARQPQHHVRLPHLGAARHRPEPGHRLRAVHRPRPTSTPRWRPASTTTACSARCSTVSACRP